ncbi:hypothetical protein [Fodinibius halophilus]|uniref:Outer membrane protein beta-barrel domain-containing protein n=1 Tax=Fodinibius halophilus TaxID=1736908 RepID=A0A6M1STB0_9BACT|nr:hypothetical protein [Fodinibius halophilus]NGP87168.1 hypothetical protein [Fodinibius halophilus]
MPAIVRAQMFSVGEEEPRFNIPSTIIYVGLESIDVSYSGPASLNSGGQFEFTGTILRAGYKNRFVNFRIGSGGGITGLEHASYFDAGGDLNVFLDLYKSEKLSLLLPVRISSRFVNMTNSENYYPRFNSFRFGSLAAGVGPKLLLRPMDKLRIHIGGIPSYGFGFASAGSDGGSYASVALNGQLYFDRLFGDSGLSIGYKYFYRSYDIDQNVYDYKIRGHNIEIGFTF